MNCSPGIVGTFVKAFVRACAGSSFSNPQMHRHFNMSCLLFACKGKLFECGLFQGAVAHDISLYLYIYIYI